MDRVGREEGGAWSLGRGSRRHILGPSAPSPFAPPLLLFCPLLLYRPQLLCFSTAPPALPLRPCSAAPLICGERRLEPGAGPLGFLCWSPGPRRPCWSTTPALSYGQVISSALFSALLCLCVMVGQIALISAAYVVPLLVHFICLV